MSSELIRKTDVLDLLNDFYSDFEEYSHLFDDIAFMIPVNAVEQKQGHWIANDDYDGEVYYTCSRCEDPWVTIDGNPQENKMRYCPYCGAKMEVEET